MKQTTPRDPSIEHDMSVTRHILKQNQNPTHNSHVLNKGANTPGRRFTVNFLPFEFLRIELETPQSGEITQAMVCAITDTCKNSGGCLFFGGRGFYCQGYLFSGGRGYLGDFFLGGGGLFFFSVCACVCEILPSPSPFHRRKE